jgi:hypothetical protein
MSTTHTPYWPWLPAHALQIRLNNLVKRSKRIKRVFGMTNWTNYRTRALLYAGRSNWSLLNP